MLFDGLVLALGGDADQSHVLHSARQLGNHQSLEHIGKTLIGCLQLINVLVFEYNLHFYIRACFLLEFDVQK